MKKPIPGKKIVQEKLTLQLYVSGMTSKSMDAIENIRRICDELGVSWAAHDLRKIVVCGNEVMLHFISTMRVPGLEKAAMEVFELQVFNDAGKIAKVRVFFDAECLLPRP